MSLDEDVNCDESEKDGLLCRFCIEIWTIKINFFYFKNYLKVIFILREIIFSKDDLISSLENK